MKTTVYLDKNLTQMSDVHLKGLVALVGTVWDPGVTINGYIEKRAKQFQGNPYAQTSGMPIALLTDGDKVVGCDSGIPCGYWIHGREYVGYYQAGLYIDPEYRGKSLGGMLPKEMQTALDLKIGFFVVPQQLRTHLKMKWTIPGKIPEFVKIIDPVSFLSKIDIRNIKQFPKPLRAAFDKFHNLRGIITQGMPRLLLTAHRAFCGLMPNPIYSGLKFYWVKDFDLRVDTLWNSVKSNIQCAQIRNSRFMNWHFPHHSGWHKLIVEDKNRVVGYAIVSLKAFAKNERLSDITILSVIDLLWELDKPEIFSAMLAFFDRYAVQTGADAVHIAITQPNAQRILLKRAFIPMPGTVYFGCHANTSTIKLGRHFKDWYITRGDADAAGSFGPSGQENSLR